MNRRNFFTAMAVTTACAIPGVAALLARNSFERTLTAEVAKPTVVAGPNVGDMYFDAADFRYYIFDGDKWAVRL